MRAYDGAEVCEIVGIYLLPVLSNKCHKECIVDARYVDYAVSRTFEQNLRSRGHFQS